ncbi:MAG TPA: riboflavin synthase [Sutterella sp.]|nr:riboflavin synthase [Sutterella sp.]
MFTGIIEAVGKIREPKVNGAGLRVSIATPEGFLADTEIGDSIAVNGACMTVVEISGNEFTIEVSAESLEKTTGFETFGEANLEKALRVGDTIDGHIVSGHVDAVGNVLEAEKVDECVKLSILVPKILSPLVAYKGSVAINGVSLTINAVEDTPAGSKITINLIPHTLKMTTLSRLKPGHFVNVEADMLARYVERVTQARDDKDGLF